MGNNVIDIWPGRGFDSVISFAAFIPCTQFSKCLIVSERVRCTSWYPHMCACTVAPCCRSIISLSVLFMQTTENALHFRDSINNIFSGNFPLPILCILFNCGLENLI